MTAETRPCPASTHNPFDSDLARAHSRSYRGKDGRAVSLSDPDSPPDLFASAAVGAFRGFVLNPQFSCVGAKSAVMHEGYRLGVYDTLAGDGATAGLGRDLYAFSREVEGVDPGDFRTFVALFRGPTDLGEPEFERLLWEQLRKLNAVDAPLHGWDPTVSPDPADPHFAFSFAETAFFIVGLNPQSSRLARRFPWPALVFNPHAQFEHLKEAGRWERLKDVIRAREQTLQGSLNPNLADHGDATEARQYSGRPVEADWEPPFQPLQGVGRCPFGFGAEAAR